MNIKGFKIIILLSYICIASISAAIITPALPQIEHGFGLSHGALEWIISIFLFGYVIGQLIYGPLANRFGRLKALRAGLLINILGVLICIIAISLHSYNFLLLGRFITALGAASGLSLTFILINELLPTDKAKYVMSFATVSFSIGIVLAVLIGGIITEYLSWQDCFWALLAHGALMFALTYLYPETLKQPKDLKIKTILSGYLKAISCKELVIYSFIVGMCSVFSYCYSASAPIYAHNKLHLLASQYGYWNILNMAGMIGSGFLSAYLMKRYHAKKVLIIGFISLAISLLFLYLLTYFSVYININFASLFFINTAIIYLCNGLLFPAASYLASNSIKDKASASSMMSFINMFSAMLSVVILGYLPFSSLVAFVGIITVFYLFGVFIVLFLKN